MRSVSCGSLRNTARKRSDPEPLVGHRWRWSGYVKMALVLPVIILRKLRALRSLRNEERLLVLEAALLPVFISTGIDLFGVRRTQGWLRWWASRGKPKQLPPEPWAEILMARRAQRRVMRTTGIRGTCLPRSLTLWTLLLRRGLPTDLRVGFRRLEGKIEGHAWVEFQGIPLNEDPGTAQTYSRASKIPSHSTWVDITR